jgi:hypothetical protein
MVVVWFEVVVAAAMMAAVMCTVAEVAMDLIAIVATVVCALLAVVPIGVMCALLR